MIDINELRSMVSGAQFEGFANSVIHSLLDRIEMAESEAREEARLNGMDSEREAALMAKLEAAEKERDALRAEVIHVKEVEFPRKAQAVADGWRGKCERLEAKIAEMEKQEPVAWTTKLALEFGASRLGFQVSGVNIWGENGVPLYALPGAQGVQ